MTTVRRHIAIGGKRTDLGGKYFRSMSEANYARLLTYQKIRWEYEPTTFWFEDVKRGNRFYTPDFWLPDKEEFHEVKGWLDPASKTKLDRMKRYHPGVTIVLINDKFFKDCERKGICRLIPGWECSHNKVFAVEPLAARTQEV